MGDVLDLLPDLLNLTFSREFAALPQAMRWLDAASLQVVCEWNQGVSLLAHGDPLLDNLLVGASRLRF